MLRSRFNFVLLMFLVSSIFLQGQRCAPVIDPDSENNEEVNCVELSGTISEDTTLDKECYEVIGDLTVGSGATLIINQGTTLRFAEGIGMIVGPGGCLQAIGTADNPIVLTGVEQTRGYWNGLRIYDFDAEDNSELNNQLTYVTIEYGGSDYDANLCVEYSGGVAVNNCTLRHSGSYGFCFSGDYSVVSAFANNTVTENALGAGLLDANHIQYLEDSSTYSGNDNDVVMVNGANVSEDQTWTAINADYYVDTSIGLNITSNLTLAPGVTLIFNDSDEHMDVTGNLYAVGTADEPITLTAAEAVPGGWGGLRFYDFQDRDDSEGNSQLAYVTIEYGGGYHNANLCVAYSGDISVNNCTLRYSSAYGFCLLDEQSIMSSFANNTVTGNASGAGWLFANQIQYLDDSSTYTGNDNELIFVGGASVDENQTWPAIDVDYYVDTSVGLDVTANLVISPGVTLVFADANEKMDVSGSLYAVGTADEPITFTAAEETAGGWGGLRIYNTFNENNQLEYLSINYGAGYYDANLYLTGSSIDPTQVSIENCTFSNSACWGVYWVPEYVTVDGDLASANSYSNNATGNIGTP